MIVCRSSTFTLVFDTNSTTDSMQPPTTSAMTQPARHHTFLPGHVVVIICSITIQLSNLARTINLDQREQSYNKIATTAFLGVLFLSFPLLGYIADGCFTRYRTLKCSLILLIVGCTTGLIMQLILLLLNIMIHVSLSNMEEKISLFSAANSYLQRIPVIPIIASIATGVGLFEANAIQFGLDQLLEAPTLKLIAFIHWYYWTHNVVQLVVMYITVGWIAIVASETSLSPYEAHFINISLFFTVGAIIGLAAVASFVILNKSKRHLYILRAGLNPFKNIYRVLKYSWNHKVPEHRSAFTYWEEDIPHRIDLGKNKYGGPFTNEEVEDTKTFLSILPLLLCLFGYHLAGDGYSAPDQLQRTSCPSLPVLLLIVLNPLHMSTLVVVVGIPLYRLIIN